MKTCAVEYNGRLLMPGSQAFELFHDTKDEDHMIKLKKHMAELETKEKELLKKAEKFEEEEKRKYQV